MIHFKNLELKENEDKLIRFLAEHQLENTGIAQKKSSNFSKGLFDDDRYIGGITASNWMNTTHISLLAVDKNYRKSGLGTMLLKEGEAFAQSQNAEIITIHTQDYQAKTFYEMHGYSVFGQLTDSPFHGTTKYYLEKRLPIE